MCGIAGLWMTGGAEPERLGATARAMADAIAHRGPDDSGEFVDAAAGVALGFRRLSIIDLAAAGHQPMASASGRYVIVFNGEVYNFAALRAELGGEYRGHSDTEVMLAAIEAWGLEGAVERFAGMFAFALWDRHERVLHLVRDRMGVKPLYYGWSGGALLFGSELKAVVASGMLRREIDRQAVTQYTALGYIPAPRSIWRDIRKLPPGTIASIHEGATDVEPRPWWSVADVARRGAANPFSGSFDDAVSRVGELVDDSVRLRMIADVPLGVFLSGGVDSSLVAAIMRRHGRVKTFTIGFVDSEWNEAGFAAAIARHLGTEHTEQYVTLDEAMKVAPELPAMFDEPFGDSSAIPTFIVSRMARRSVTVALSGDGGDELFAGYSHYFLGRKLWRKRERVPALLRRPLRTLAGVLPWRQLAPKHAQRIRGFAAALRMQHPDDLYPRRAGQRRFLEQQAAGLDDMTQRAMLFDQLSYLPDDILAKVDRASMAASLEAREPLLDHRLVELAWSLPPEWNLEERGGKRILRALLARHVPPDLFERPKMGFALPVGQWLRGPLRPWAEGLLGGAAVGEWLDAKTIAAIWREHLAGRDRSSELWIALMLLAWLEGGRARPAALVGPASATISTSN
ncbi:MAG: asparagine synthase (glutamine-hydrolyzing) [Acidobacteriota bacterium]